MSKIISVYARQVNLLQFRCKANSACYSRVLVKREECLDTDLATKTYDEVPKERALPLIGTSWTFLPFIGKYNILKRHEASMKLYLQYGKIVRNDILPSRKFLHLYDPNDIEKVFRSEGRYPKRILLETTKKYREMRRDIYPDGGLSAEQGVKWYALRSKVQKCMLSPALVQNYIPLMDGVSQEMVQRMEFLMDSNCEVPRLLNELNKWSLESIALVALDAKLGCLGKEDTEDSECSRMIQAVNDKFALMGKLELSAFQLWKHLPSSKFNKFIEASEIISNIAQKYLHDAIERRNNSSDGERGTGGTLLDNFLLTENLSFGHVVTMVADIFSGGIETTSHSSAYVFYLLAKNPDAQQKLFDEICQVLPDPTVPLTVQVLNECRYLKASLKESMRLMPIVQSHVRILAKEIILSGYRIPAGVSIFCENYVACRLEENFPEPLQYKPERWLRGNNQEAIHPFVFLPFGFGPRGCIGKRIAQQEIWTLLFRVIQKYRLEYHCEDIGISNTIISVPDKPMKLKFVKR